MPLLTPSEPSRSAPLASARSASTLPSVGALSASLHSSLILRPTQLHSRQWHRRLPWRADEHPSSPRRTDDRRCYSCSRSRWLHLPRQHQVSVSSVLLWTCPADHRPTASEFSSAESLRLYPRFCTSSTSCEAPVRSERHLTDHPVLAG